MKSSSTEKTFSIFFLSDPSTGVRGSSRPSPLLVFLWLPLPNLHSAATLFRQAFFLKLPSILYFLWKMSAGIFYCSDEPTDTSIYRDPTHSSSIHPLRHVHTFGKMTRNTEGRHCRDHDMTVSVSYFLSLSVFCVCHCVLDFLCTFQNCCMLSVAGHVHGNKTTSFFFHCFDIYIYIYIDVYVLSNSIYMDMNIVSFYFVMWLLSRCNIHVNFVSLDP